VLVAEPPLGDGAQREFVIGRFNIGLQAGALTGAGFVFGNDRIDICHDSEAESGMHRFSHFWWLCTRNAFWGNAAFANDWQWVFGNPVVSGLGGLVLAGLGALAPSVAKWLGATNMTTGTPALDSFIGALAAFVVTWLVAFMVRLLNAPVAMFHEQKERTDALQKKLDKEVGPQSVDVSVEKWITPRDAISAFILLDVRRDFDVWTQKSDELETHIRKLYADSRTVASDSRESSALSAQLHTLQVQLQEAQENKRQAQEPVLKNLQSQLAEGSIIARGFPSPVNSDGGPPVVIDTEQWQFLTFDRGEPALNKIGGGGSTWVGVQIGIPKTERGVSFVVKPPTYVTDINIAAGLTPQTTSPVLLVGKVASNEERVRVVVDHSHYVTGMGWSGWSAPRQVEIADLKDVITGQQVMAPVVTSSSPSDNSANLTWGKANGPPGNIIQKGKKYRARIRFIGIGGHEQSPIHLLLVRTSADEFPYLVSVTTESEFAFATEWNRPI
jgi:hypothetical protein